jgi:hypothetical protein
MLALETGFRGVVLDVREPDPSGSTPGPSEVHARVMRLATGVLGPITMMYKRMTLGFLAAIVVGSIAGIATREPLIGLALAFNLTLVAAAIAWWPMFDPAFRSAAELLLDHSCHELAQWKAETGTSMPRGMAAATRWIAQHPGAPGAASLLLFVGRLRDADRAIEAIDVATPEATFAVELLRQTRRLYAGDEPDLAALHTAWMPLSDPPERRHRRECIAFLEAQLAVDRGSDPIEVMALARDEVGDVHWTMRAPWLLAKWSLVAILALGVTTVVLTEVH